MLWTLKILIILFILDKALSSGKPKKKFGVSESSELPVDIVYKGKSFRLESFLLELQWPPSIQVPKNPPPQWLERFDAFWNSICPNFVTHLFRLDGKGSPSFCSDKYDKNKVDLKGLSLDLKHLKELPRYWPSFYFETDADFWLHEW